MQESYVLTKFGRHMLFLTLGTFSRVLEGHPCCVSQQMNFSCHLVGRLHTQVQGGSLRRLGSSLGFCWCKCVTLFLCFSVIIL